MNLAKCPWCIDRGMPSLVDDEPLAWVECGRCKATGPAQATSSKALEAWNESALAFLTERMWVRAMIHKFWSGEYTPRMTKEEALADCHRMDWLTSECSAGRVVLKINNVPRGDGMTVRSAIDAAMKEAL